MSKQIYSTFYLQLFNYRYSDRLKTQPQKIFNFLFPSLPLGLILPRHSIEHEECKSRVLVGCMLVDSLHEADGSGWLYFSG